MDSFDPTSPATDVPSSPDTGDLNLGLSEISTPISRSGETSPTNFESEYPLDTPDTPDAAPATQKKKKKKKPKKSAKAKEAAAQKSKANTPTVEQGTRPPVLCISRNKHWRYISSYHVCSCHYISLARHLIHARSSKRDHGSNFLLNSWNLY